MTRIGWYFCLLILGALAAGAQLDRESNRRSALASIVPESFRATAHRNNILLALRQDDYEGAQRIAREQVRDRPIPSESLTLYAQAAVMAGDRRSASMALTVAGTRGWRDPVAQSAMAASAMEQGNLTVVAQRLAALWGTRKEVPARDALTVQLLSTAEGRAAMASTLAVGGGWARTFVTSPVARSHPAEFSEVLKQAEELSASHP